MRPILFAIIGSIAFVGCAEAPKKPQVEICILNVIIDEDNPDSYPEIYGDCGITDGNSIKQVKDISIQNLYNIITDRNFKPVQEMDKNICFSPKSWETTQNYVHELVNYIENRCSQ